MGRTLLSLRSYPWVPSKLGQCRGRARVERVPLFLLGLGNLSFHPRLQYIFLLQLNATLSLETFLPQKGMAPPFFLFVSKFIFFTEEFQDIYRVGRGIRNCTQTRTGYHTGINLGINIDNHCHQNIKCPGYYQCWVVLALFMRTTVLVLPNTSENQPGFSF